MKILTRPDASFVAALGALVALYLVFLFDFARVPFEDAAMLMRYATHVAGGHGMVWNVGEEPVDGATDFLFMAVVAALMKVGTSAEGAVRAVGVASHLLTILLVYVSIVRFARRRWIAFFTAAFFALGPGLRYVEAYFGTPFFAFLGSLTWFFALELITGTPTRAKSSAFALAALATGLTRPEGVFLSLFILAAIVCGRGWRGSRTVIASFALIMGIGGGAYLLWRISYFGYVLPNPFYAKGGGEVYTGVLMQSIRNAAILLLPLVPLFALAAAASVATLVKPERLVRLLRPVAFVLLAVFAVGLLRTSHPGHPVRLFGLYSPAYASVLAFLLAGAIAIAGADVLVRRLRTRQVTAERVLGTTYESYASNLRRWTLIALIPLVAFTVIWLSIQDYMNYLLRFQYVLLPIAAMVWPMPFARTSSVSVHSLSRRGRVIAVALGGLLLATSVIAQRSLMPVRGRFHDGRYDLAVMLNDYADRGYTMATTEAGLLPFYSEWNAIDVYGYNDRWIAHHGLSPDYLDRRRPELIVIAGAFPLEGGRPAIETLKQYVHANNYELAAAYGGDRTKVHYYYVRRGFADADTLTQMIRSFDYTWYMSGRTAIDFANE